MSHKNKPIINFALRFLALFLLKFLPPLLLGDGLLARRVS